MWRNIKDIIWQIALKIRKGYMWNNLRTSQDVVDTNQVFVSWYFILKVQQQWLEWNRNTRRIHQGHYSLIFNRLSPL